MFLIQTAQLFLFLLLAPLLTGWVKYLKCLLQNRRSPSLLQPYYNLIKLIRKQIIVPKEASWIFRFTPYLIFGSTLLASILVPLLIVDATAASLVIGDVIVLIGLFALARFFLVLAGMDIGTAFGGMGSSREMLISSLAEPSALLVLFTLAMTASSTNLTLIIKHIVTSGFVFRPSFIFSFLGLVMITLAETGRIPVDNPATHLELTMTHEAMILEYSGRYLALIEWGAQIKLMIYCVLLSNIFFPWGIAVRFSLGSLLIGFAAVIGKLLGCGVVLAGIETSMAKMRLFKAPYFLSIAFMLCLLAIFSHIILEVG